MRADPGRPTPVKVVKVKPVVVKAPAGDVASSGGDYGMKQASQAARSAPVKRAQRAVYDQQPTAQKQRIVKNASGSVAANLAPIHAGRVARNQELAQSAATKDTKGNADRQTAQAYLAAHPEILKPPKAGKGGGSLLASIDAGTRLGAKLGAVALAPAITGTLKGIDAATGSHTLDFVGKTIGNAPKDAAELVASTPTSTYMLGKTAVTHPEKLPGMIAKQYTDVIHDPLKAISERPVSTAAMFAPTVKIPGRIAGKVARVAGKQTLKGETRTLPGTALKQETVRSKDAAINLKQARSEAKNPAAPISADEIRSRVDAHFEYRRKHMKRVEASKSAAIKPQVKALPKDQRAQFVADELKGARGGAANQNDRTFVREFGSTWQRTPQGVILKPKNATEGHLHPTKPDAQAVVDRLGKAGHGDFVVKAAGDKFGVVPKTAADQLRRHQGVGSSQATYAKVLRVSRQKFTNAVLPVSPKWLSGQVVEGTLRANAHAGGPVGVATGLLRERKVYKALEKQQPGTGKEFRQRALPGGHYGGQIQEFRTTPLHHIFNESDGKIGDWLAKAGRAGEKAPGAKRVVNGWNRYTRFVFDQVNGRFIENTQQRAMLGRSLKDSHLMERSLLGLSDKAAREAAQGLRGTETQVQLARSVERAYGKYSNFTPAQRERNLHWTPFLPWYANAVKFLTQVLPNDHPVLTSLLAAGNVSTQKEREKLGLSLHGANHKPLFMMGGIPTKGGGVIRIGHYTPFALGESKPTESLKSLVLPQFASTYSNLGGIDWKGDPLKHGVGFHAKDFTQPETLARALASQVEALTPGGGQLARITGVEDKLSAKKDAQTIFKGPHKSKRLLDAVAKEVNPVRPTGTAPAAPKGSGVQVKVSPIKLKPIKVKPVKIR